jgi:hypothetical protein
MHDADPDVAPMNPAYLIEPGEVEKAFEGWRVIESAERKLPGQRRRKTFLARRP